jgi:anti-sigma factor RsiW
MNHPDDDALLRFLLETDEEEERGRLENHLDECPACRGKLAKLRRETEMLGSFDPDLPPLQVSMPKVRGRMWRRVSPLAAALVVGIALGYGVSRIAVTPERTIVASYLTKSSPFPPDDRFIVCETVDIPEISDRHYFRK